MAKNKLMTAKEAVAGLQSGSVIMLGGFFYSGAPFDLVRALTDRKNELKDLTLIANDACSEYVFPDALGNALMATGMFRKLICTYPGHNRAAMQLASEGKLELEIYTMGTFTEKIRAGGAGLGGVLTPVGVGTEVAEGKEMINVCGRDYLLELPLRADVALIYGSKVDACGNVYERGIAGNFNVVMALAADFVVVETREYVSAGEIDASEVTIPEPFIDAIVLQETGV
ncbi:MAG: 3-oxoacid CoA-transferase subunit A [Lachnospiraceae bacterium]|nr:3-oxoacid CoA-transferase subunit A [Lachnospiraceae bacterium]